MSLEAGARLGAYEIVGLLGAGGMGEVYRAKDLRLKRDVALKVLPTELANDRERLARFQREAETLAALNHPNIAHVYGLEDGALVMELVEGETLAERLAGGAQAPPLHAASRRGQASGPQSSAPRRGGASASPSPASRSGGASAPPIPLDEILEIARQIAEALEAAHEHGIVHRDLKPANVKVRPDGTVKVLDFGLAKAIDGPGSSGGSDHAARLNSPTITSPAMMTMHGAILGTAAYMAPEQAKGKPVDKRADIWAFGCVLYEMLTGRRPFDGEDVTDTIAAVVTKEPDWSALPSSTPAGVRRLLARCLVKDRKRRLRDIGDAHLELSDDGPIVLPQAAPVAAKSRVAMFAAVTASIAAAILAYPAISHWRETTPQPRPLRLTIDAPPQSTRLLSPQVSPDGRWVAFSVLRNSVPAPELWIRRLDEGAPTMIQKVFGTGSPFWSPDGRALVVPSRDGLMHVDLATNATRVIAKLPTTLVGLSRFLGTWSAQGGILVGLGSTIQAVSDSGELQPLNLEGLPERSDSRFPVFLPDGRRFMFLSNEPGGDPHVFVASLDGGPVTRLFAAESQAEYAEPAPGRGHVLFVRAGNLMAQPFDLTTLRSTGAAYLVAPDVPFYAAEFVGTGRGQFSVSPDGVLVYISQPDSLPLHLTWFDRQGKELGTVGEPALYFGPRIAPDGRRVAVARLDPQTRLGDIYVIDGPGVGQRLTFDPANDIQPVWDRTGEHVIWASHRRGKSQLYRKRADGTGAEEQLHESAYSLAPDDVSPDGRSLLFRESHPVTQNDLWLLPLDGSGAARPLVLTDADEPRARFSPDGRSISYMADGRSYVQTFPQMDSKWQIGGLASVPQWRRDGKEIYYQASASPGPRVWARTVLSSMPLRLGEPMALFMPPLTPRGSFFHVSADGQRFLFAVEPVQADSQRYQIAIDWAKPGTTP